MSLRKRSLRNKKVRETIEEAFICFTRIPSVLFYTYLGLRSCMECVVFIVVKHLQLSWAYRYGVCREGQAFIA
jgi:hypothetical protein